MNDVGKLYRDASMLAMRKKQVNRLQQENERIRNDTIDECAAVAENWEYGGLLTDIAAAIRKLKDKP